MKLKIFIILFIVAGLILLSGLIKFILYPAYLSTVANCNIEKFQQEYGDKYQVAGQVTLNKETKETTVYLIDETNIPVLKHEICHVRQIEQNRLFSCPLVYVNEAECYFIQRYWEIRS